MHLSKSSFTMQSANAIIIVTIIFGIVYTDAIAGERSYGTYKDRHRERICRRSLICQYRAAQCIKFTPENQWTCNRILEAISANRCTLQEKCDGDDRSCADKPAGDGYTELHSDYCPIGEKCYVMANGTMTTTMSPVTTSTAGPLAGPTSTVTEMTTSSTVTANTTETSNVTEATSTAGTAAPDSGVTTDTVTSVTNVTSTDDTNATVTTPSSVTNDTSTDTAATEGTTAVAVDSTSGSGSSTDP